MTDKSDEGTMHPDDVELNRLEAEAAEQNKPAAEPEPQPEPDEDPLGLAAEKQRSPMIPKARFDEVNNRAHMAELEAAKLRGRLEAMEMARQQTQQPQQQQQRRDPILEIETNIVELATAYENGELTFSEYKARELVENRRKDAIVAQRLAALNAPDRDAYVQKQTAQLERDNKWLAALPPQVIQGYADAAAEALEARGVRINPKSPGDVLRVREEAVSLMKQFGLDKILGGSSADESGRAPAQPFGGGVTAQDRKAKLDMAASQPPAPGSAGRSISTDLRTFNQRVAKMSEADLEKLSDADLEALAPSR